MSFFFFLLLTLHSISSTNIEIYAECVSSCTLQYTPDITTSPFTTLSISRQRSFSGASNLLSYKITNAKPTGIIRFETIPDIALCGIIITIIINSNIFTTKDFYYISPTIQQISTYDLSTCILPPTYYCNIYPVNYQYINPNSKWLQCLTSKNTIIDFQLKNKFDYQSYTSLQPSITPTTTISPSLIPTFVPSNEPTSINPTKYPSNVPTTDTPTIMDTTTLVPTNLPSVVMIEKVTNFTVMDTQQQTLIEFDMNIIKQNRKPQDSTLYMIIGLIGMIILLIIVILVLILLYILKTYKLNNNKIDLDSEKQKLKSDNINNNLLRMKDSLSESHIEGKTDENDINIEINDKTKNNNDVNYFPLTKGENINNIDKEFIKTKGIDNNIKGVTPTPPLPPGNLIEIECKCDDGNGIGIIGKTPEPPPPPPPNVIMMDFSNDGEPGSKEE